MSNVIPIIRSWSDGYVALRTGAEYARGTIELNPGTTEAERWPRTTGADVIAIAAFLDPHLRSRRFQRSGYARRWNAAMRDLELYALPEMGQTYSENRSFWRVLAAIFAYLSSTEAPPPSQAQWSGLFLNLGKLAEYRNVGPKGATPFKQFPGVKTFDDLYIAQYKYLRDLRGADELAPEPGMAGTKYPIPRSTNADVIALADYWSKQLASVKRVMGHDGTAKRWNAAVSDVTHLAVGRDPNAVYAKNNGFWRDLKHTAIHVAVADEAPSKWDMALDSLKESVKQLPDNLAKGAEVVASKVASVAGDVAEGAGKIVNQGAKGLFSGIGTPLIVAGGLVGAFLLLRRDKSPKE
ncbi:MAG: hypothetical protein AB7O24_18105 [Kofleriaceae bacterium]